MHLSASNLRKICLSLKSRSFIIFQIGAYLEISTCRLTQLLNFAQYFNTNYLKRLAQAEIIKKSVILFWLINMTI